MKEERPFLCLHMHTARALHTAPSEGEEGECHIQYKIVPSWAHSTLLYGHKIVGFRNTF